MHYHHLTLCTSCQQKEMAHKKQRYTSPALCMLQHVKQAEVMSNSAETKPIVSTVIELYLFEGSHQSVRQLVCQSEEN